jgi:heme/copper-type cytochrome/quinol oxidase subunit 3
MTGAEARSIHAPALAAGGDAGEGEAGATLSVGMAVALAAIAMTFAALLLAYGIVRVQAPAWPIPGERPVPPLWGYRLAATAVALAGSLAMWRAARGPEGASQGSDGTTIDRGGRDHVSGNLVVAGLCGVAFLGLQVASFVTLRGRQIGPGAGLGASVVYALGAFHGVHALAALLALAPALYADARRRPLRRARLRAVASFWHLVTGVWVVVFLAVFVA